MQVKIQNKLQRLGRAYVDGSYEEPKYKAEKRRLGLELKSLTMPQLSTVKEAGLLLLKLPRL